MPVRSDHRRWERKLDGDMHIVEEQPRIRLYPEGLAELDASILQALQDTAIPRQARVIGSHWGISHCGVTTGAMIETATPVHENGSDQAAARLNRQLFDIVPDCLSADAWGFFRRQQVRTFNPAVMPDHSEIYLFHVEAGIRIHELYALLDGDDAGRDGSLAARLAREPDDFNPHRDYSGPWALETMGGAGGQTIAGAFSTGTHGGDVAFGPIADAVVALHLIDAGGRHHWIERTRLRPSTIPLALTDPELVRAHHPDITHHHSDDLMDAAVIACGRMGAICSVVLRVVRQFALQEFRDSSADWGSVRNWITGAPTFLLNRFVQVVVNPYGTFSDPDEHVCYVTARQLRPLDAAGNPPLGRAERALEPGKGRPLGKRMDFTSRLCAADDWLRAAIDAVLANVKSARETAIITWLAAGAVIVFPLTPPPLRLLAQQAQTHAAGVIVTTTALIDVIGRLIAHFSPLPARFGDTLALAMNFCIHFRDPIFDIAPLVPLMRAMVKSGFDGDQEADPDDPHTPAISYAAMDLHDYTNIGCVAPGDSIEVFFDATSPKLVAFIDRVLERVRELGDGSLTGTPEAFGGYMALRFMADSRAFLSMQQWPRTCSIEIAGLSKVDGTGPFLRRIHEDAIAAGAVLHWGQKNEGDQRHIEECFGGPPGSRLFKWREALSTLSEHGRHDLFSTPFTKRCGLEITTPRIEGFISSLTTAGKGESTTVSWSAERNPPETLATLAIIMRAGTILHPLSGLKGSMPVSFSAGPFKVALQLDRELNGNVYTDRRELELRGFDIGDEWTFTFEAQRFLFQGNERWLVDLNLGSATISNQLRVARITASFAGVPAWIVRNLETGDLRFTTAQNQLTLATPPRFNTSWRIFSEAPAAGTAARLDLRFAMTF